MVLKGNLLYNGDFETGTAEGWETEPYGKTQEFTLSVVSDAKYRGNYGGQMYSETMLSTGYLAYNKIVSIEEYEAFLGIMYVKKVDGAYNNGVLFGLDDKGNLINDYKLGYNIDTGVWRKFISLIRGFGDVTHFKLGHHFYGNGGINLFYIDEVKLIPLNSIKGYTLAELREFTGVTTNKQWYSGLACVGKCNLRSIVRTDNVSGTSPTLDIKLTIALLDDTDTRYTLEHSQFTDAGMEEVKINLPEVSWVCITYTLGGTDPSFDIYHHLRIEPY